MAGSGYRRPPALVRRGDGQTIQLTPLLYEVLRSIDGRRGYDEIASDVSDRISREAAAEDIRFLVESKLRPLGVLRQLDGSQPQVKKANPLLALRLRKVISNPNVTRRITAPFAFLFRPQVAVPVLLAFAAATGWLLFEKGLASPTRHALYEPGMLLLVFGLAILSAGFHEFGHAAAARYVGASPGAMGVGIYLVWPVFYTDVTDAYRLGRGGRLRVDVGGLYFNAIFAVGTVAIWAATGWDALLLLVPIQILHMLHQLVPFVRFDGYHILADLTGVPDLFAHIKPTLRHLLPTRWGRREPGVLRPWARAVVTLWVLTVIPVLLLTLGLIVTVFPRVAATMWDSVGIRMDLLERSWASGQEAESAVILVSILALALPVVGIAYLVSRVVRRTSLRVWRATSGRPVTRSLAALVAASLLALLAWAWWPNGQYRPIQAGEPGTLSRPAARVAQTPPLIWAQTSLVQSITSGAAEPRLALVLSPEGVPVTEPGRKQIVILPSPDEAWPFPFDRPAPPGEGDNQALAVNTEDGSTVTDMAVAVVWVTDGAPVDQTNEAWALASCADCTTMSVAFQGLFVVGQSDIITPQNIAVAVNHDCLRCQTSAIAVQLVATLTTLPTDEAMADLSRVWTDLEALEQSLDDLSLEELLVELDRIEMEIVQILVDDGVLDVAVGTTDEVTTSTDGPAEETATSSETSPDSTTEEPSTSGETDTGTGEPSPAPTAEPSSEPTAEPSPTPTSGS
jgi:putative peptide zinc metalloprotease protein